MFLLSLPCALGFNLLSGVHPMGGDSGFLDLEDFLVSNILLPAGSLIFVIFATFFRETENRFPNKKGNGYTAAGYY